MIMCAKLLLFYELCKFRIEILAEIRIFVYQFRKVSTILVKSC